MDLESKLNAGVRGMGDHALSCPTRPSLEYWQPIEQLLFEMFHPVAPARKVRTRETKIEGKSS